MPLTACLLCLCQHQALQNVVTRLAAEVLERRRPNVENIMPPPYCEAGTEYLGAPSHGADPLADLEDDDVQPRCAPVSPEPKVTMAP